MPVRNIDQKKRNIAPAAPLNENFPGSPAPMASQYVIDEFNIASRPRSGNTADIPIPTTLRALIPAYTNVNAKIQQRNAAHRLADPSRPYSSSDIECLVGNGGSQNFEGWTLPSFVIRENIEILNIASFCADNKLKWKNRKKQSDHYRDHQELPVIKAAGEFFTKPQEKSLYLGLAEKLLRAPLGTTTWGGIQRVNLSNKVKLSEKEEDGAVIKKFKTVLTFPYRLVRFDAKNNLLATFDIHRKVVCTLHSINPEFFLSPDRFYNQLGMIFTEDPAELEIPLDAALTVPEKSLISIITVLKTPLLAAGDEESDRDHE